MGDININASACITKTQHWGMTKFHNICNGSVVEVQWGIVDWLPGVFVGLVAVIAAGFLASIALAMHRDFR